MKYPSIVDDRLYDNIGWFGHCKPFRGWNQSWPTEFNILLFAGYCLPAGDFCDLRTRLVRSDDSLEE